MQRDPAPRARDAWDRLTAVKLALQLLARTTPLSAGQRRLVRTALEATDGLIAERADRWRAERAGGLNRKAAGDTVRR